VFAAVLDACVLWPSLQRDFLLSLAAERLYRPLWSDVLLDEVEYNEAAKLVRRGGLPADTAARAAFLRSEMVRGFRDAIVTGFEPLEGSFGLPDSDDEHVLAAAVLGSAGAIVTLNFKDFPAAMVPDGIDVLSPARFTADTVVLNPHAALRALEEISARSGRGGRPGRSVTELNETLVARYGLDEAMAAIPDRL
jgi:hypothetical protein